MTQITERQRSGKGSGVPDFKPVGEQPDLDRGIAVVVAVRDGVDDGFVDGIRRQFLSGRRPVAKRTGANGAIDFSEHEIARLIRLLEQVT